MIILLLLRSTLLLLVANYSFAQEWYSQDNYGPMYYEPNTVEDLKPSFVGKRQAESLATESKSFYLSEHSASNVREKRDIGDVDAKKNSSDVTEYTTNEGVNHVADMSEENDRSFDPDSSLEATSHSPTNDSYEYMQSPTNSSSEYVESTNNSSTEYMESPNNSSTEYVESPNINGYENAQDVASDSYEFTQSVANNSVEYAAEDSHDKAQTVANDSYEFTQSIANNSVQFAPNVGKDSYENAQNVSNSSYSITDSNQVNEMPNETMKTGPERTEMSPLTPDVMHKGSAEGSANDGRMDVTEEPKDDGAGDLESKPVDTAPSHETSGTPDFMEEVDESSGSGNSNDQENDDEENKAKNGNKDDRNKSDDSANARKETNERKTTPTSASRGEDSSGNFNNREVDDLFTDYDEDEYEDEQPVKRQNLGTKIIRWVKCIILYLTSIELEDIWKANIRTTEKERGLWG